MNLPANYSAWPTSNDVSSRLAAAGITLRGTAFTDRIPNVITEVTDEVARRTLRQFIADTVDETRIYSGNDTSELEIDEMVSLTAVSIIGYPLSPGYTLYNPFLVYEQGKPQTRIVVGAGSMPAWTTQGVIMPYISIFPAGRQNIQVTGKFGFAPTIPTDLWNSVCGEISSRLTSEAIFNADGRVTSWKGGDETVTLALDRADGLNWHSQYEAMVNLYKRPQGRRLRNLTNRMI
jgi:hypothetical protein